METTINQKQARYHVWLFIIIAIAGVAAMYITTAHDYEWTTYLREHRIDWFKDLMADSLFEGELPGGGDLSIFYLIFIGVCYIAAWLLEVKHEFVLKKLAFVYHFLDKHPVWAAKLRQTRPYLGFIVTGFLCSTVFVVHTTKWIMARPRPKLVLRGEMPFSEWYEYGAHFIANGSYRGSFPSGHTASAFVFMTLAYVLIFGGKSIKIKLTGWGVMLLTVLLTITMGIARSMSRAHWVTDTVFILFANWLVIHALYFWGLRVPEQTAYFDRTGKPCPLKPFYEIIISFWLFILCLALMAIFMGIRAYQINNCPWLVALTPFGVIGVIMITVKFSKLNFFNRNLTCLKQEKL